MVSETWLTYITLQPTTNNNNYDYKMKHQTAKTKQNVPDGLDEESTWNAAKKQWKDHKLNNILFFFMPKFKYIHTGVGNEA